MGSDAINRSVPTGKCTLLYQEVSIPNQNNKIANSEIIFDYDNRGHLVNFIDDTLFFKIDRKPIENLVSFQVGVRSSNGNIENIIRKRAFYTDLLTVDKANAFFKKSIP